MKGYNIIRLRPGVFQLEKGCCEWEWDSDGTNIALISYCGIHTELEPKVFGEQDNVL